MFFLLRRPGLLYGNIIKMHLIVFTVFNFVKNPLAITYLFIILLLLFFNVDIVTISKNF